MIDKSLPFSLFSITLRNLFKRDRFPKNSSYDTIIIKEAF